MMKDALLFDVLQLYDGRLKVDHHLKEKNQHKIWEFYQKIEKGN